MTDKICCNCKWFGGVNCVQGVAPCELKKVITKWNNSCEDIWLVPNRMTTGAKTHADCIRSMTDEQLAQWLAIVEDRIRKTQLKLPIEAIRKDWFDWLQQEADGGGT